MLRELGDEILEYHNNDKLILFTGAGFSKQFGFKLWEEAIKEIACELEEICLLEEKYKEKLMLDSIFKLSNDPRIHISKLKIFYENVLKKENFKSFVFEKFDIKSRDLDKNGVIDRLNNLHIKIFTYPDNIIEVVEKHLKNLDEDNTLIDTLNFDDYGIKLVN